MEEAPELSVFILSAQPDRRPARRPADPASALFDPPPRVEIAFVDSVNPSAPALRAAALGRAKGRRAALLSDQYEVDRAWLEAAASASGADVWSGAVEAAPGVGWIGRSIWLWEYAHFAGLASSGALPAREAAWIPAGAAVYARPAELELTAMAAAASEVEYHRAMAAGGKRFVRLRELRVRYRPPRLWEYLAERRRWSARLASQGGGSPLRALLPPLWLARWAGRWLGKPRLWPHALAALPWAVLFACTQALGEFEGATRRGP